jgi:hypothetical protein
MIYWNSFLLLLHLLLITYVGRRMMELVESGMLGIPSASHEYTSQSLQMS